MPRHQPDPHVCEKMHAHVIEMLLRTEHHVQEQFPEVPRETRPTEAGYEVEIHTSGDDLEKNDCNHPDPDIVARPNLPPSQVRVWQAPTPKQTSVFCFFALRSSFVFSSRMRNLDEDDAEEW